MIQNDKIDTVMKNTFLMYNIEDGFFDILFGFSYLIYSFLFMKCNTNHWLGFVVISACILMFIKGKIVKPRIGYAVFKKYSAPAFNRAMVATICTILVSTAGIILSFPLVNSVKETYSYFYIWAFIGLAIVVIGGIRQQVRYYLYAALMMVPVLFPAFYQKNPIFVIITFMLFALSIMMMEKFSKNELSPSIKPHYVKSLHAEMIVFALLLGLYIILSSLFPNLSKFFSSLWDEDVFFLFGNYFGLIIFGIGLALLVKRFMIYAACILAIIYLPAIIPFFKHAFLPMMILLGISMLTIGFVLLFRFIKKNPVIEISDQEELNETK